MRLGQLWSALRWGFAVVKKGEGAVVAGYDCSAYGYYFPTEWSEETIYSHLDPSKKNIQRVHIVKNKMGQNSGKVLLDFASEAVRKKYIDKYNEDFIITNQSSHRVILKPFVPALRQEKIEDQQLKTKNAVKVKNLDFEVDKEELKRMGADYGEVTDIEMYIRPNGLNNGMATVFFRKAQQATDFAHFCHGLKHYERSLSA